MKTETDMPACATEDGSTDLVHHADGLPEQAAFLSDQPAPDSLGPDIRLTPAFRTYRHRLPIRVAHWVNALCLPILIMSGFQIFNAHTALYWGDRSDRDRPVLSIKATISETGERRGATTVLGHSFDTTGVLGFSDGSMQGFPSWMTIPSGKWLAMGRQWHLFFAWVFVLNGLAFGLYALLSRHLSNDLFPKWADLRRIGRDLFNHLSFRHPTGEEAKRYNVLQKIAYTGVIFGVAPLIVLTGLTMSPAVNAAFPWLLTIFGGRQSARTIHFVQRSIHAHRLVSHSRFRRGP